MPERTLCERIDPSAITEDLRAELSAITRAGWSSNEEAVVKLRKRLLEIQSFRCAYCQVAITADQAGLRELDHILPKEASAICDPIKSKHNAYKHRTHTQGYPQFRYEWRNLVVCCKQCNTNKGSFDPLLIRPLDSVEYPSLPSHFLWVHPHLHAYSDHIRVTDEWLYEGRTYEGKAVIRVCKLDKSEVLGRRRLAESAAARSTSLKQFLHTISGMRAEVTPTKCMEVLVQRYGVSQEQAARLIEAWFAHGENVNVESLNKATLVLEQVEAALHQPHAAKEAGQLAPVAT